MKATEIFVEQVLVGFMVLLIVVLPFQREALALTKAWGAILSGGTVVGIAYMLGIVFDRFADTLMQGPERHSRLRFGLRDRVVLPADGEDLFPEDELRIRAMRESKDVADWLDYLARRVRLARAMAVFLPGISAALLLASTRQLVGDMVLALGLAVIAMSHGFAFLLSQCVFWGKAPRTDASDKVREYAEARGFAGKGAKHRQAATLACDLAVSPPCLCGAFLGLLALLYAVGMGAKLGLSGLWVIPVAGGLLSALSGWAWWRVRSTWMTLLKDLKRFPAARQGK